MLFCECHYWLLLTALYCCYCFRPQLASQIWDMFARLAFSASRFGPVTLTNTTVTLEMHQYDAFDIILSGNLVQTVPNVALLGAVRRGLIARQRSWYAQLQQMYQNHHRRLLAEQSLAASAHRLRRSSGSAPLARMVGDGGAGHAPPASSKAGVRRNSRMETRRNNRTALETTTQPDAVAADSGSGSGLRFDEAATGAASRGAVVATRRAGPKRQQNGVL